MVNKRLMARVQKNTRRKLNDVLFDRRTSHIIPSAPGRRRWSVRETMIQTGGKFLPIANFYQSIIPRELSQIRKWAWSPLQGEERLDGTIRAALKIRKGLDTFVEVAGKRNTWYLRVRNPRHPLQQEEGTQYFRIRSPELMRDLRRHFKKARPA